MKTRLAIVLALALFALPAFAGEGCAMAAKGGCIWNDQKADFSLAAEGDSLILAAVVNGCPGKRAGFQAKLADELGGAAKGTACEGCPFGVKDLALKAENTELGATVTVTGPADKRAEFQKRFEAKMEARKTAADSSGCGCGH